MGETLGQSSAAGSRRVQDDTARRNAFAVKLTNVLNSHELRYRFDMEANGYDADLADTGIASSVRPGDSASYIQERRSFRPGLRSYHQHGVLRARRLETAVESATEPRPAL